MCSQAKDQISISVSVTTLPLRPHSLYLLIQFSFNSHFVERIGVCATAVRHSWKCRNLAIFRMDKKFLYSNNKVGHLKIYVDPPFPNHEPCLA